MSENQELEPAAEELLRSGRKNADQLSIIPSLYSIAISLKRIADFMEKEVSSDDTLEMFGVKLHNVS